MTFEEELRALLNRYSVDNECDTPDYMLAHYMIGCMQVFENVVHRRDEWFGFDPWGKRK